MKTKFLRSVLIIVTTRCRANRAGLFMRTIVIAQILWLWPALASWAGETKTLPGHVPLAAGQLQPLDRLAATTNLSLAIVLPSHNQEAMTNLLRQIYDPASPQFHRYLTPQQFREMFGPTKADYQAVMDFAKANGLEVVTTHDSRRVLDVRGHAADIEKAFHVTMRTYQHPKEPRKFFAPDVEPSVDASVPILQISGLNNYSLPKPMVHRQPDHATAMTAAGSAPGGTNYWGNDFRHAYAPGVSLTGAGQFIGLVEFEGYYVADITNYEHQSGLTTSPVPLNNVLLDGVNGLPDSTDTSGVIEVSMDIEMAVAMAPGLSELVVFEGTSFVDIFDSMASYPAIKQLSCSWVTEYNPVEELVFETCFVQMAMQGQSFFVGSGDGDAWFRTIVLPDACPHVTSVGGTTLAMSTGGGAYLSEIVWNWGYTNTTSGWPFNGIGYWGSGGGYSSDPIPSWQQSVSMAFNLGSTTNRNIPDIAMIADDLYLIYDNGLKDGDFGGTSAGGPLWAGFTALINQQAAANGQPSVGFLNPAIYAIGQGAGYSNCFHDITVGNNIGGANPALFPAVPGYDLCTGWGTPSGSNLINALAGPPTETSSWLSGAGGKWEAAANWSLTIAPDNLQSLFITNAPGKIVTIDGTTSGGSPTTMSNFNVTVGAPAGSVNTLFLNNAGTTTALQIFNSLTINHGGVVSVSNSTVLLDSSGTMPEINGVIVGGNSYSEQLTLNGGQLTDAYGYIGYNADANLNVVLVTGAGAVWNNSSPLYVGDSGTGNSLTISNGGNVFSASAAIGNYPNADDNTVTVTGPGSVWTSSNPSGGFYVGQYGSDNTLAITNGGTVSNATAWIGWASVGDNNAALVTGAGWYNSGPLYVGYSGSGNTLTIGPSGTVASTTGLIGYNPGANGNSVLVSGPGAVWNTPSSLYIGYQGSENSLAITNGGTVVTEGNGVIGWFPFNSNNVVTVSGNGAQWQVSDTLYVSFPGSSNQLVIGTGGTVLAGSVVIGIDETSLASNNVLQVSGGSLLVSGQLTVGDSTGTASLILKSGSVNVGSLVAVNGVSSVIQFNGGLLTSSGTSVSNRQIFAVGDGVDAATYQLDGGMHAFANNLEIHNTATLTGCGTVTGNVVVDAGGTVLADCGTLTFAGIVTNNGILRADGGSVLEAYGSVVNYGTIDAINGTTNFHAGFVNHGTILTAANVEISQASPSGQNFIVHIPSVNGHTYQLQYSISMRPTNWIDTASPQAGTGSVLTFTDLGGRTNVPTRFYHVQVTAP